MEDKLGANVVIPFTRSLPLFGADSDFELTVLTVGCEEHAGELLLASLVTSKNWLSWWVDGGTPWWLVFEGEKEFAASQEVRISRRWTCGKETAGSCDCSQLTCWSEPVWGRQDVEFKSVTLRCLLRMPGNRRWRTARTDRRRGSGSELSLEVAPVIVTFKFPLQVCGLSNGNATPFEPMWIVVNCVTVPVV